MMTCIALDDEPLALELLKAYALRLPGIELRKTFTRASDAKQYLKEFPVDLLFLDIRMPDISGVDFYRNWGGDAAVIFTTAFSEYAVTGFELSAVDYLLKPIKFERFAAAVEKAERQRKQRLHDQSQAQRHLMLRAEYSLVKVGFDEILFVEPMDDYARFHLVGRKPILTLLSMKQVMQKLPPEEFVRVHRSYIVALDRIEQVRNKVIALQGHEIPIGTTYEEDFWRAYQAKG